MRTFLRTILFVVLVSFPVLAQQPTLKDSLLDCMTGNWILRGKIAGKETIHDIKAEWVLAHQYILIHEISREKNAGGQSEYEANVYVGWDDSAKEYICIWLDIWGGVTPQSIGRAKPNGNEIAYLFSDKDGKVDFHTTFSYNKDSDTWQWLMDNDEKGILKPFARVKLTRK
jgi:hypothetical protein